MEINMGYYVVLSMLWPLIVCLLWWWNEIWYATSVKARCKLLNLKLPPGHLGIPLFGEYFIFSWYFQFLRRPDSFITSKIQKYGKNVGAYKTHLYGSPTIIACSPSLCKRVLASSKDFKQEWPTNEALGPNSVITIHGSRHELIKGFFLNEFNRRDSLARIVPLVQPFIVRALKSWSQKGQINTFDQLKKVTLDYMGRYTCGLETGDEVDALEKLFHGVNEGVRAQPWNIPATPYHHALKCRKKIAHKLKVILEKKKKKMEGSSDMMDGLMQMKDNEGRFLKDEEVIDNVLSNIAISYIGVAYPVTWSMYFLANNSHVLHKLREENMEMAREKNGADLTYEDIMKLKYTNKVVDETIRIANISGFLFKKATKDIEFEGYLIPKGWRVIVWLRYLHTDPSNFEDPMAFNPNRWDSRPKIGTYLAFGGGTRICPGSMLARLNIALFLHHLSIGYRWELVNLDVPITYLSHPIPADGLQVFFSKV